MKLALSLLTLLPTTLLTLALTGCDGSTAPPTAEEAAKTSPLETPAAGPAETFRPSPPPP